MENAAKKNDVIVGEQDSSYKICKIIPHADGGFGVYLPYLRNSDDIFLGVIELPAQHQTDSEILIPATAILEKHRTDRQIKLSIHQDGFVQFSGHGITSGRDKVSGKIKGLGVMSKPLSTPISTGSTFGITFWGLNHFEKVADTNKDGDTREIRFSLRGQYVLANPSKGLVENTNGYIMSGYVFPSRMKHYIYSDELGQKITGPMPDRGNAVFTLRVITFPNSDVFLGLLLTEIRMEAIDRPPAGFMVSGPKEIRESGGKIIERSLFASVPKWFIGRGEKLPTLNYN